MVARGRPATPTSTARHDVSRAYDRFAFVYDAVYSEKDYRADTERLHSIIQRRNPGARSLLDVAGGTGHDLESLRDHYDVTGVDLSAEMLAVARGRLPGTPLFEADRIDFSLDRRFDAITCLFSAIGYLRTIERVRITLANFARHLDPGGGVIVEPWITPADFIDGTISVDVVEDDTRQKLCRLIVSSRQGRLSTLEQHILIGTSEGAEHIVEEHKLGLFTVDEHKLAFTYAGLSVAYDPKGLTGRGLYVGTKPERRATAESRR